MAKKNQQPPRSFEDAIEELEKILEDVESGSVGLEESLERYERGTFLIQHCRSILTRAEKQIEEINKTPEGELTSQPLEDQEQ